MQNRRDLLATALAGAALAAVAVAAPAIAAPAAPGSVTVDVSRLRAQGLGPNASRVQATLERELAGAAAPGTSLVVRVRGISMTSYAGNGGTLGGSSNLDGMDSEASVIGPSGRVIATYPVNSSSSASSAGPWYAPGIEQLRLDAMARTNAGWIRRYVRG